LLSGTPLIYLVTLGIASVSGAGIGKAFAIATVPALFGGITFGGFVPLMIHMGRQEQRSEGDRAVERAASAAYRAARPAPPRAA